MIGQTLEVYLSVFYRVGKVINYKRDNTYLLCRIIHKGKRLPHCKSMCVYTVRVIEESSSPITMLESIAKERT